MVPDQTLPAHARAEMCMQPVVFVHPRACLVRNFLDAIQVVTRQSVFLTLERITRNKSMDGGKKGELRCERQNFWCQPARWRVKIARTDAFAVMGGSASRKTK